MMLLPSCSLSKFNNVLYIIIIIILFIIKKIEGTPSLLVWVKVVWFFALMF